MGKEKKTAVTDVEFELLQKIGHHLGHPRKMAIIQYLHLARFATASVIVRKCGIKQPSVSRYMKSLTSEGLLTRERIGNSILFALNAPVWNQVSTLFNKVSS